MDESLREASRTGNVGDLYTLILRNGNVLRQFDRVEFIDTPLHIAAEEGCMRFAMEMMNLKPSFARKLNQQGLSPLHLAVDKGHKELAVRLVEIDKDLVRVRGKDGETPLHYISKVGNNDGLLDKFLEACPDSIRDVTTQNRTGLHIAVDNNRLDDLEILIGRLKKKSWYREVVNRKDEDGNTALHLAASKNQPEMIKVLLNCKGIDKHATNQTGLTTLDVARQHNNRESITILRGCSIPMVSNFKCKLEKSVVKYVTKASSLIFHDLDNISSEERNTLLVILGLLLTSTYQAILSPPGGVWQGDDTSKSKRLDGKTVPGKSVMQHITFLYFYIPINVVFMGTFFLTIVLLKPFPRGVRTAVEALLAFLAICFDTSLNFIAPPTITNIGVFKLVAAIGFILMFCMCSTTTYDMSKLSVTIIVLWLVSFHFITISLAMGVTLGVLLFVFLYDEFWKGTVLGVGVCGFILHIDLATHHNFVFGYYHWEAPTAIIGGWLFLSLCRFCIKRGAHCLKFYS